LLACGAKKQKDLPEMVTEIDVTGTYELEGAAHENGEDIYGPFGILYVRKEEGQRYEIALSISRGAPSYNSGELKGILTLKAGKMVFSEVIENEMNCIVEFTFDEKGVAVEQNLSVEEPYCGFGYGVQAIGYMSKISSEPPSIPSGPMGEQ